MPLTHSLRRQHDEALALVAEINRATPPLIETGDPAIAADVEAKFAKLVAILQAHFTQEDELLYPLLMASSDATTAATARIFFEEMGGIGAAFRAFADSWNKPGAITRHPRAFARETQEFGATLKQRIARENDELYPLADWLVDRSKNAA